MTTGQILDFNNAKKQGDAAKAGFNVDDVRDRLHANPRSFVEWLYCGRAYLTKHDARIGNVAGEAGNSLSIDLVTGLWHDHATEEGGDLISLYRTWRGYGGDSNFVLSMKELARDYFGDPVEIERPSWQPTALEQREQSKVKLGTKPREDMLELGAPVRTWKYYNTHGDVIASVVRFHPNGNPADKTFRPYCYKKIDGKTKWVMGAPDLRPLYRLPDISTSPTVVLCEGEGCAEALATVGIQATTAMQGAYAPVDKTDWSSLAGKTVIIWPDKDKPGFDYAKAVAERLLSIGCTVLGITPPEDAPEAWDAADCVSEGKNAHEIIGAATPVQIPTTQAKKPRIRLMTLADMENIPPIKWLIEGVITENGLSMIWGKSGSMKSFVALDMAMCIATGLPWHGHAVKKGRAIYVAAEGSNGLALRAMGWRQNRGRDLPEPNFLLIPHGVTLTSDDLAEMIKAIVEAGEPPVFIVIDTMSRTFGTGNPNQPVDMNLYVDAADKLRQATGANTMVVHHAGEDEDRNEIGNKGLRNASDTVIFVKRTKDKISLINEAPKGKQKDGEEFKAIALRPAKVSYEKNGNEHSTLVLNLDETPQTEPTGTSEEVTKNLGSVEKKIISALKKADGQLGVTRLAVMTQTPTGTLYGSLQNLEDKKYIQKLRSDDNRRDEWKLI